MKTLLIAAHSVYQTVFEGEFIFYIGKVNRTFDTNAERLYTEAIYTGSEIECRELLDEIKTS